MKRYIRFVTIVAIAISSFLIVGWSFGIAEKVLLCQSDRSHIPGSNPVVPIHNAFLEDDFFLRLAKTAEERIRHHVVYNGAYVRLDYPGGDVPSGTGVCTDVVIRSYRAVGIDLQVKVHEDMTKEFQAYPNLWGLSRPDPNIDHRRVPNLMTFFSRHGMVLPISQHPADYQPGDVVTWKLDNGLDHIGIVGTKQSPRTKNYMVVHNIGAGPRLEDVLFEWKVAGHYRFRDQ